MDRNREEGGGTQCFLKKEDKSLIVVEHVETTVTVLIPTKFNVLSLPHWTSFLLHSCFLVCSLLYPVCIIRLNIAAT